jgi:predicted RNA binding protein YcfA (HicA-like mRNA interferase family)
MGRLSGFRYKEIVRKLKAHGFEFDRQAAGSHEIWFHPGTNRYTTVPNALLSVVKPYPFRYSKGDA